MNQTAPLASFLPPTLSPAHSPILEVPAPIATRVLSAADLLAGARQVVIEHEGKLYRLSLTKNDRLILQK